MVNPRIGQVVYYIKENGSYGPMMVVNSTHDYIEGFVFEIPIPVWRTATYAGRNFPPEEKSNFVPGTWFYPFPEL